MSPPAGRGRIVQTYHVRYRLPGVGGRAALAEATLTVELEAEAQLTTELIGLFGEIAETVEAFDREAAQ